ncbi:MAG: flavin reductase family protein [Trueperaceae bacterium]
MIDDAIFKDVLGRFATGITVVATDGADGPKGITVNAFLSLSLRPPLVGVAIDRSADAHDGLHRSERYGVSILSDTQAPLSNRFARRDGDGDPGWERLADAPVLAGAIGWLSCRIVQRVITGDHTLFVAQVEAARTADGAPLAYFRGGYRRLQDD